MTADVKKKWLVVVNPNAGRRKVERDWKEISSLLMDEGFDFDHFMTEGKLHAIQIAKENIEKGYKKIIVVGGDGTLNEVVNGVFLQKRFPAKDILLGIVTIGTGNDWGRMYKIPAKYKKAVKVLKKGKTIIQDAGYVDYHLNKTINRRYFINMAGMGYDALVAQKTNRMKEKGKGGPFAYFYNLITGLYQYKNTFLEITINDKKVFEGNIFSMSLGICKYNGGGMMQLPFAIPDDGIFDVTIVKKTTKFRVLRNIKNLYDGTFTDLPEVELFKGRKISIVSRPENSISLETDGESLGHSPLNFNIIPRCIQLIVNKKYFQQ